MVKLFIANTYMFLCSIRKGFSYSPKSLTPPKTKSMKHAKHKNYKVKREKQEGSVIWISENRTKFSVGFLAARVQGVGIGQQGNPGLAWESEGRYGTWDRWCPLDRHPGLSTNPVFQGVPILCWQSNLDFYRLCFMV